jgi:uncharacterized lipoprotein YmbA
MKRWHPYALALPAALLIACASSPPTRYHVLQAVAPADVGAAPAAAISYRGPPLRVVSVLLPPALDRQELVRETAPGQIEVREFDQWAAPLARLARQALSEDLALRLPPGMLVYPGATWPQAGAELRVEIDSLRVADAAATTVLSWSLRVTAEGAASGAAASGAAMRQPSPGAPVGAQLRLSLPLPPGAGDSAASTAQAYSRILAQLADRIAADLGGAGR